MERHADSRKTGSNARKFLVYGIIDQCVPNIISDVGHGRRSPLNYPRGHGTAAFDNPKDYCI